MPNTNSTGCNQRSSTFFTPTFFQSSTFQAARLWVPSDKGVVAFISPLVHRAVVSHMSFCTRHEQPPLCVTQATSHPPADQAIEFHSPGSRFEDDLIGPTRCLAMPASRLTNTIFFRRMCPLRYVLVMLSLLVLGITLWVTERPTFRSKQKTEKKRPLVQCTSLHREFRNPLGKGVSQRKSRTTSLISTRTKRSRTSR